MMNKERMEELIEEAVLKYGLSSRMTLAIEEMSELTKELCKWERGLVNPSATSFIAEEIADVTIMLHQLVYALDCGKQVDDWIEYKLKRLKKLLYG